MAYSKRNTYRWKRHVVDRNKTYECGFYISLLRKFQIFPWYFTFKSYFDFKTQILSIIRRFSAELQVQQQRSCLPVNTAAYYYLKYLRTKQQRKLHVIVE